MENTWENNNILLSLREDFSEDNGKYNNLKKKTDINSSMYSDRWDKLESDSKESEFYDKEVASRGNIKVLASTYFRTPFMGYEQKIFHVFGKVYLYGSPVEGISVIDENSDINDEVISKYLFRIASYMSEEAKDIPDYTIEDLSKDILDIKPCVEEAIRVIKELHADAKKKDDRFDNYKKAYFNRKNRIDSLDSRRRNSWKKENPIEENKYAIWHSKNGDRRVTILKIDEPNQRAKINTDKGATMYVPLSTLEPDFDAYNED